MSKTIKQFRTIYTHIPTIWTMWEKGHRLPNLGLAQRSVGMEWAQTESFRVWSHYGGGDEWSKKQPRRGKCNFCVYRKRAKLIDKKRRSRQELKGDPIIPAVQRTRAITSHTWICGFVVGCSSSVSLVTFEEELVGVDVTPYMWILFSGQCRYFLYYFYNTYI